MPKSWDHTIEFVDASRRNPLGYRWECSWPTCREDWTHAARFCYLAGTTRRWFCSTHAEVFAERHGLVMPAVDEVYENAIADAQPRFRENTKERAS